MSEESVAVLEAQSITSAPYEESKPMPGFVKLILGICCYAAFASIYYLMPNKRLLSIGDFRFTLDALLECVFTMLSLPAFFLVHRYGVTTFDENQAFAVPEWPIELLVIGSIIFIALGNGIHLTSKVAEQILTNSGAHADLASIKEVHFLRQIVGHVAPHIGWQTLFAALMLGQLKRPFRSRTIWVNRYVPLWGIVFGLLFFQGTIAAGCLTLGFSLTLISCAVFAYLAYKSRIPSYEIPIQRFFMSSQVTFLVGIMVYWVVPHIHLHI